MQSAAKSIYTWREDTLWLRLSVKLINSKEIGGMIMLQYCSTAAS